MAHFGVPKEMLESARIVRKLISKARTEEHQSRSFATVDGGGALAQCAGTARESLALPRGKPVALAPRRSLLSRCPGCSRLL